MIRDIRNLFRLEKENKAIKYKIYRGIRNIFEYEEEEDEDYYKPVQVGNFWSNNYIVILNTKVAVIEIKHYQLKNI